MNTILKTIAGVAMMATLLLTVSCKDDKESNPYLTKGNDSRPAWEAEEPNYLEFEHTMAVDLNLQDILLPYVSDDDLMCATINNKVRAVSTLDRSGGQVSFPMVIAGNSGDGKVSLHYYCSRLSRIYTLNDWMNFTPSLSPTSDGISYIVNFIPQ
ncbi:MAG: hypothetical protein J6Y04_07435 [Bacteroidaceae bacterium]|nr:hypothetical protein [Bacteroidaceae bacterium]